jgi:replication factor C subunit 3/5
MEYLPWVEKYRPNSIDGIISHAQNIETIKKMLEGGSLPHLLFHGTPGTGKTSLILAIANELYGNQKNLMLMKLDASDDRGINSVREDIKCFAEKKNMFCKGVKLIILDEADSMTFDAQFALRRIIEKYSETTRFCLICNYENKIIPAIRSRCKMLRFSPISSIHIENRLKYICDNEKLTCEPTVLNIISLLSKGDLRKSINFLQSLALQASHLTLNNCYKLAGIPSLTEVKELLENLLDDSIDFNFVIKKLDNLIRINGYSLSLVVKEIIAYLLSDINVYKSIDSYKLACYISDISDLENRVSKSTFEDIYISGLVGIFKKNCILLS